MLFFLILNFSLFLFLKYKLHSEVPSTPSSPLRLSSLSICGPTVKHPSLFPHCPHQAAVILAKLLKWPPAELLNLTIF